MAARKTSSKRAREPATDLPRDESSRKGRHELDLNQKVEVLQLIEQGVPYSKIATKFNIG